MTINELKQIPIETLEEDLDNPSNIVSAYTEYMLEHRCGVMFTNEDYTVLQQMIGEIDNTSHNV